ncbi:MAG: FG-GAP-like repeat-containing protein [Phycisphaerales bacterium JB059]
MRPAIGIAWSVVLASGWSPAGAQTLSFTDITLQAGVDHVYACAEGYPGMHHQMVGGVVVADFNNDGWPDLFAPTGGVEPDRLYINQQDGTFADEAPAWGIDQRRRTAGLAVGDVNRDGWVDLFVVSYGDVPGAPGPTHSRLFLNRANGGARTFEEVGSAAGVSRVSQVTDGMGACFGDYDLDGDLDLFVSAWINAPGGNRLFRNEGCDERGVPRFTDVTGALALETDGLRGFTPRFVDLTGDRYPELLLTNDFGTSRYYENLGGVAFEDRTQDAGVTHDCNGMGSSVGDVDADGDLDWFMTNIYFPPPADSCGNTLYLQGADAAGRVAFTEHARDVGVHDAGWGWGTELVDLDLDGDLDLLATGGWSSFPGVPARVYLNQLERGEGLGFEEAAAATGLTFLGQGRGLVTLDLDRDQDRDVVIVDGAGPMRLFRNNLNDPANGVTIVLRTEVNPCLAPGGMGTRVEAWTGDRRLVRAVDGSSTYLGASETSVLLGLGGASAVDRITLRWADGTRTDLESVPGGSRVEVFAWHEADLDRSGQIDFGDAIVFVTLLLAGDEGADLNADGALDGADVLRLIDALGSGCAR